MKNDYTDMNNYNNILNIFQNKENPHKLRCKPGKDGCIREGYPDVIGWLCLGIMDYYISMIDEAHQTKYEEILFKTIVENFEKRHDLMTSLD